MDVAATHAAGSGGGASGDEEEGTECAICFEPVGVSEVLPCSCKVAYCSVCWDRSLAAGLNTFGRARCPTCRCPVRVDFDAITGKMVFTRAEEEEESEEGTAGEPPSEQRRPYPSRHASDMERLVDQARPVQLRLLQQFGETHVELRMQAALAVERAQAASTSEAGGKTARALRSEAEQLAEQLSQSAGAAPTLPPCVCGGRLRHVSYRERLVRCLRMRMPHTPSGLQELEDMADRIMMREEPCYFCDLCGLSKASGGVWTCENGNNTILHANAFDVCERCFAVYCAGTGDS